jgi:hypothetical protein
MKYIPALFFPLLAFGQPRQHTESAITIHLHAPPAQVLPLFGPVREAEWAHGWNPNIVYPENRAQTAGSVFTMGKEGTQAIWVLTEYDLVKLRVGYVFIEPGVSANQIEIVLKAAHDGMTEATVTYRRTGLSDAGDVMVTKFAQEFPSQRDHWEHAINARLKELNQ